MSHYLRLHTRAMAYFMIIIKIDGFQFTLFITYRTLSSSTNMITTRACGFELRCSIIRSKSSDLALRETFSETAIQMPSVAAMVINDDIPCKKKKNKNTPIKEKIDIKR